MIQRRRGHKKAVVAVARKVAILLHAMWRDDSEFRFGHMPDAQHHGTETALATVLSTAS
jgi:hypothetical protein